MYPYDTIRATYQYDHPGDDRIIAIERVRFHKNPVLGNVTSEVIDTVGNVTVAEAAELLHSLTTIVKVQLDVATKLLADERQLLAAERNRRVVA